MTNKRGGYVKYYDFVHKYPHDLIYDKHETVKSHRRKFEKMYYEKQLKKVEEYFKTRSY